MDEASLSAKTVAELKVLLAEQSLPVSGKKSELVDRLLASSPIVSLEEKPPISISFDEEDVLPPQSVDFMSRMKTPVYGPVNMGMAIAIVLALLMISATLDLGARVRGGLSDEEGSSAAWHPLIERAAEYGSEVAIIEVARAVDIVARAGSIEQGEDWAAPLFDALADAMLAWTEPPPPTPHR